MFQVTGSLSTSTGVAPARTIWRGAGDDGEGRQDDLVAGADAQRGDRRVQRRRAVADGDAMLAPHARRRTASSNRLTNGPSEEIQPVSMHSARYFFSLPSSRGSLTGMKSATGDPVRGKGEASAHCNTLSSPSGLPQHQAQPPGVLAGAARRSARPRRRAARSRRPPPIGPVPAGRSTARGEGANALRAIIFGQ